MSPFTKRTLLKVLPYPIIALIGGLLYFNVERGTLGDSPFYPTTNNIYNWESSLIAILVMSLILGGFVGTFEEIVFKQRLRSRSFLLKLSIKTALYLGVIILLLLVLGFVLNATNLNKSLFAPEVVATVIDFFSSYILFSIITYVGSIIVISLFLSEIVDYLGLDVASSFLTGKYSKPVQEQRIFMFLDMKGSTSIAEKLGNGRHYELINEYYRDMAEAITSTHAAIYQYVGDEIVLSWNMKEGLMDQNCLRCFFLIEKAIRSKAAYYEQTFDGIVPQFKAGVHFGEVTRGQVGNLKRDLLYTGDVLNATARIQGYCNELNSGLLISGELKEAIGNGQYKMTAIGEYELRGRKQPIELYCVKCSA